MGSIGIFGGTFNPPHNGHIRLAKEAVRQLGLSCLYIVPAGVPPHKVYESTVTPQSRLELCRLAFGATEKVVVSPVEIERGGKSFTIDTVRELQKMHPTGKLFLLMGSDMFVTIEQWREYEELLRLTTIAVFERYALAKENTMHFVDQIKHKYKADIVFVEAPVYPVSSTELRSMVQSEELCEYLPGDIVEYMIINRLYPDEETQQLLTILRNILADERYHHSISVANEAIRLAARYGEDCATSKRAGLLHDITKEYSSAEQLKLCLEFGIILDNVEAENEKLLHAKTSAYYARKIDTTLTADMFDAIFYHTTGRAEMSLLEKIIYLADYIEPYRNFEGVEEVRKMAYLDIDKAMYLALVQTVGVLLHRNKPIHENTLRAKAYFSERITDE